MKINIGNDSVRIIRLNDNNATEDKRVVILAFDDAWKNQFTFAKGLFVGIILMTVIIPISDLTLSPYFDYAKLADLAVYMNIFNMVILGYILRNVVLSLAEKFNPKVVLTLASFGFKY